MGLGGLLLLAGGDEIRLIIHQYPAVRLQEAAVDAALEQHGGLAAGKAQGLGGQPAAKGQFPLHLLGLAKALAQVALEEGGDGGGVDRLRLGGGEQALVLEGLQRSAHRGGGVGRKGDMLHEDMGCGTPLGRGKGLVFQHEGGAALQGGGVPHQGGYGDLAGQAGILEEGVSPIQPRRQLGVRRRAASGRCKGVVACRVQHCRSLEGGHPWMHIACQARIRVRLGQVGDAGGLAQGLGAGLLEDGGQHPIQEGAGQ